MINSATTAQTLKPIVDSANGSTSATEASPNIGSTSLAPLTPLDFPSSASFQAGSESLPAQSTGELPQPVPDIHPSYFASNKPESSSVNPLPNQLNAGRSNWLLGGGDFWSQAAVVEHQDQPEPGFLDIITVESFYNASVKPYRNYRFSEQAIMLVPTSNQEFGWASLVGTPYLKRDAYQGLSFGMSHHFISGPIDIDLHPRLHEFILGYQIRRTINDVFSFDCSTTVGFYSDFKGSAWEGVRLPSHAVGMIHLTHRTDVVFGVDYLDRDDIKLLPVFGISWHDYNLMSLRYDLVFPRPRIDYTINDQRRLYLMGLLGGGTWDIEFVNGPEDVMTYRDYRVVVGQEKRYLDGSRRGLELGYAFDRRLTLRELPDQFRFRNAFVMNFQSTF